MGQEQVAHIWAFASPYLTSAFFGAVGGALLSYVAKPWISKHIDAVYDKRASEYEAQIRNSERISQQRWEMKREVFIRALKLVDAWWANIEWKQVEPDRQPKPTIEEAREIHNLLSLTCADGTTIQKYLNCLNCKSSPDEPNNFHGGMIAELREAIRAELDFENVKLDADKAWLTYLPMKD